MAVKMTNSDTAFTITVTHVGGSCISGHVTGPLLPNPLYFSDLGQLVLSLDSVFDAQNFPQAFQRARRFTPQSSVSLPDFCQPADAATSASLESFTINVLTRRSSSWQGFVIWADDTRAAFPSTLALLRLISGHFNI
ncbi:MAG: hypothetical protein VB086_06430 [Clostridiaceae bacterium]|nr:hypothetical protein [Clostridiaceae bacterium]